MICSQTTGERLASSVASYRLVRLTLAYSKGREVRAADGGSGCNGGGRGEGGFKWGRQRREGSMAAQGLHGLSMCRGGDWGEVRRADVGRLLWGGASTSKNRPSRHKYKSPKIVSLNRILGD